MWMDNKLGFKKYPTNDNRNSNFRIIFALIKYFDYISYSNVWRFNCLKIILVRLFQKNA